MIRDMQVFQFMSIQREPLLYRLLKKTLSQDCIVVLDLEDTLSCNDKEKSIYLKKWGRLELTKFVYSYPDFFKNKEVGIRVNGLKSGELEKDLETIRGISKIWDLHCIVGPMIETFENISEYLDFLKNQKIQYETFIPIVETIKGVNNLSSIVEHKSISYAIYGHNDYSLESKHWPFYKQDEIEFWDIVSFFIKKVEAKGACYVHPPISHFSNERLSSQVYLQLQSRCSNPCSIMTINSSQTALFNRIKNSELQIKKSELRPRFHSLQDKIDLAVYIKTLFSKKKRNFGIDLKTGRFFSPHMYISAIKFLEQQNA